MWFSGSVIVLQLHNMRSENQIYIIVNTTFCPDFANENIGMNKFIYASFGSNAKQKFNDFYVEKIFPWKQLRKK